MAQAPRERLNHLLELAAQGPAGRAALMNDLADLLLDWPSDWARAMRAPFEALLEKTSREVDAPTRSALAKRLEGHEELPVSLLNEFFLEAPQALRARILALNDVMDADTFEPVSVDAAQLVETARTLNGTFPLAFAKLLSLPADTAENIIGDASGQSLAVACKGSGLDRAAFSALAVLTARGGNASARLAAFDQVPQCAAERLALFWRNRG
jgi:Uncharacterised protein conserved in bacteria (DUF2336)